ncbi:multidrug effflux MFS transporter [Rhodalgimonas zhirmunskyi]|uniref:Bcr/CflA family efflux transporter n=1 Tax=Rhodalgimonas zhirmunskyi TaxID=2964767 RepID=A0AAJ1U3B8_9RHOB|nr:multidrug effflux MFS transporter [Rhodoalgimonas zhirmunskyi]MDQ2092920.1 multidrug effflux MFS transporter [Rhodoalgimonas zhirmunskyi]
MPAVRTPPRLLTLILLTSISVLSLNMFLPSLKKIALEFEVDYGLASLSLGGYLAISALLQLVMGPMSDKLGRRPVLLAGVTLFTLASIGCALAGSIWVFLGFRVLQGGIVSGMVLSRAIVRDMAPPQEAARLLAMIGTAMALAPLMGPVIGGGLDEIFGWRANFWVFAGLGAGLFVLTWVDLGETNLTPSKSYTAQFRSYPELVSSKLFWAYCLLLVASVGGFYAFLGGAPQVGADLYGLTPSQLGLGMGSTSTGFMAGTFLSTRLARHYPITRLMVWGRLVAALGPALAIIAIALGAGHPAVLFCGAIFVGLGNGITLPGANAGVMSVAPHLAGSASGLSGALTVGGGAVITGVVGALVAHEWGAYALLASMVVTSLVGLWAARLITRLEAAQGGV